MTNILEDIQLLDSQHSMETATEDQQMEILAAIKELSEIPSSVPDSEFHKAGVTMNQSGSGTQQHTARGNVYSSGGGNQFNAERQYFGKEDSKHSSSPHFKSSRVCEALCSHLAPKPSSRRPSMARYSSHQRLLSIHREFFEISNNLNLRDNIRR